MAKIPFLDFLLCIQYYAQTIRNKSNYRIEKIHLDSQLLFISLFSLLCSNLKLLSQSMRPCFSLAAAAVEAIHLNRYPGPYGFTLDEITTLGERDSPIRSDDFASDRTSCSTSLIFERLSDRMDRRASPSGRVPL